MESLAALLGYFVMFLIAGSISLAAFWVFYWCILIPMHYSISLFFTYKKNPNSEKWNSAYVKSRMKLFAPFACYIKRPFSLHHVVIQSEMYTIDYRGAIPRVNINNN